MDSNPAPQHTSGRQRMQLSVGLQRVAVASLRFRPRECLLMVGHPEAGPMCLRRIISRTVTQMLDSFEESRDRFSSIVTSSAGSPSPSTATISVTLTSCTQAETIREMPLRPTDNFAATLPRSASSVTCHCAFRWLSEPQGVQPVPVRTPEGFKLSSRGQGHGFCARRPRAAPPSVLPTPQGSNGSPPPRAVRF